jgi:ribosomal protein S18 acetylase RimI-like enzyme
MTPVIRPLESQDLESCAKIIDRTPLWGRYGLTGAALIPLLTQAHQVGDVVQVADLGRGAAGFAWVVPRGTFGRSPYLRLIAVSPEARGAQLGAQLLRQVEQISARSGTAMFLLVSDFNLDAQRFYQREGYQELGRLPDFVLPGVAECLFRKALVQTGV